MLFAKNEKLDISNKYDSRLGFWAQRILALHHIFRVLLIDQKIYDLLWSTF